MSRVKNTRTGIVHKLTNLIQSGAWQTSCNAFVDFENGKVFTHEEVNCKRCQKKGRKND